jgi:serine/threonine-protein kinase
VSNELRRGGRLGKYKLERRLGRGAFAEVWRARDLVEKRVVALKVAHPEVVEEWGREEFEQEARIASRLDHPNIVSLRNADWIEGRFVIATDLAKCSLANYPGAKRSAATALGIVRDMAAALAHAHSHAVLHRDVKPENILIFDDGRAALSDFGASRFAQGATRTLTEVGTLGYMAPEQAYGKPRFGSDVFALGLIAYELLTGRLLNWPFSWPPQGFDRFAKKVAPPLRPVLRKAAEFDPRKRYSSGEEFHDALERAFAQIESEKPKRRRRPKKRPLPSPLALQAEIFRRAHGRDLALRFHCHRCDGPLSEAMFACPWCGSRRNSFRNVSRFPLVCPECERGVRPEWKACPWCYAGRFESNGKAPPRDREALRTCGRHACPGQLRLFMRYCPLCKRKPKRSWTHDALPVRCPRCRWPSSREFFRFCPWCARREPRAGAFQRSVR